MVLDLFAQLIWKFLLSSVLTSPALSNAKTSFMFDRRVVSSQLFFCKLQTPSFVRFFVDRVRPFHFNYTANEWSNQIALQGDNLRKATLKAVNDFF